MAGERKIRIIKDGPYLVSGGIPLLRMRVEGDDDGYPCNWVEVEQYPRKESYVLCRCGASKNKPYCDGSHKKSQFDGTETASRKQYLANAKEYKGPDLRLTDNKPLCVGAGFCERAGNIWNLTVNSDTPSYKSTAIKEAADCPSGRLVVWDVQGNPIEPEFEQSIAVTEDQDGVPGPLWVRGGVKIESADGSVYENRNRVTLCNCGKSKNKPLCDGTHVEE